MRNKKEKKDYVRLPGKGRSPFCIKTLWMGRDHLLYVISKNFSEEYKRFYFRDIHAIFVQKTNKGKVMNIVFAAISCLMCLLALITDDTGANVFFLLFCTAFIFLAVNWLLGPTCLCLLSTAVQKENLGSLNRLRSTLKIMKVLKRKVESVQGRLSHEDLYGQTLKKNETNTQSAQSEAFSTPIRAQHREMRS